MRQAKITVIYITLLALKAFCYINLDSYEVLYSEPAQMRLERKLGIYLAEVHKRGCVVARREHKSLSSSHLLLKEEREVRGALSFYRFPTYCKEYVWFGWNLSFYVR